MFTQDCTNPGAQKIVNSTKLLEAFPIDVYGSCYRRATRKKTRKKPNSTHVPFTLEETTESSDWLQVTDGRDVIGGEHQEGFLFLTPPNQQRLFCK